MKHQSELFKTILDRWAAPDRTQQTIAQAVLDIGVLCGIIISLDTLDNYTLKHTTVQHRTDAQACRRGDRLVDGAGNPFRHERDPGNKICVWCGDGSPPAPPDAYEKKVEGPRFETVSCAEHGSHRLEVRPDGSYDKPDCEMFKFDRGAP